MKNPSGQKEAFFVSRTDQLLISPLLYEEYINITRPLHLIWTFMNMEPELNILINVQSLVVQPEDSITLGSGTDPYDEDSVIFKVGCYIFYILLSLLYSLF